MTGDTLRSIREDLDFSIRDLAARWGVSKSTLHREEEKDEVRCVYADAISHLKHKDEMLSDAGPTPREKKPPTTS